MYEYGCLLSITFSRSLAGPSDNSRAATIDTRINMDHGRMDHGEMDYGSPHEAMCKMSMVWSWLLPTDNVCVVFPSWRIHDMTSFYFYMLLILFLGAAYEWLRLRVRQLDARLADQALATGGTRHRRRATLLPSSSEDRIVLESDASSIDSRGLSHRTANRMKDKATLENSAPLLGM